MADDEKVQWEGRLSRHVPGRDRQPDRDRPVQRGLRPADRRRRRGVRRGRRERLRAQAARPDEVAEPRAQAGDHQGRRVHEVVPGRGRRRDGRAQREVEAHLRGDHAARSGRHDPAAQVEHRRRDAGPLDRADRSPPTRRGRRSRSWRSPTMASAPADQPRAMPLGLGAPCRRSRRWSGRASAWIARRVNQFGRMVGRQRRRPPRDPARGGSVARRRPPPRGRVAVAARGRRPDGRGRRRRPGDGRDRQALRPTPAGGTDDAGAPWPAQLHPARGVDGQRCAHRPVGRGPAPATGRGARPAQREPRRSASAGARRRTASTPTQAAASAAARQASPRRDGAAAVSPRPSTGPADTTLVQAAAAYTRADTPDAKAAAFAGSDARRLGRERAGGGRARGRHRDAPGDGGPLGRPGPGQFRRWPRPVGRGGRSLGERGRWVVDACRRCRRCAAVSRGCAGGGACGADRAPHGRRALQRRWWGRDRARWRCGRRRAWRRHARVAPAPEPTERRHRAAGTRVRRSPRSVVDATRTAGRPPPPRRLRRREPSPRPPPRTAHVPTRRGRPGADHPVAWWVAEPARRRAADGATAARRCRRSAQCAGGVHVQQPEHVAGGERGDRGAGAQHDGHPSDLPGARRPCAATRRAAPRAVAPSTTGAVRSPGDVRPAAAVVSRPVAAVAFRRAASARPRRGRVRLRRWRFRGG